MAFVSLQVLIDAGVKVNLRNMYGVTASSGACACNGAPDCPTDKIKDKIGRNYHAWLTEAYKYQRYSKQLLAYHQLLCLSTGERELSSFFNQDFKSEDGILNDGSKTLTQNNRDCNEKCQQTESNGQFLGTDHFKSALEWSLFLGELSSFVYGSQVADPGQESRRKQQQTRQESVGLETGNLLV